MGKTEENPTNSNFVLSKQNTVKNNNSNNMDIHQNSTNSFTGKTEENPLNPNSVSSKHNTMENSNFNLPNLNDLSTIKENDNIDRRNEENSPANNIAPNKVNNNQLKSNNSNNMKNFTPMNQENQLIEKDLHSADKMQRDHQQIDDNYQQQLQRKFTLADRILNRSMVKEVQANRRELFNASAEYRIQFYRTVLDGRLSALQEKTEAGLMMIKAHYRTQVGQFMTTKMLELAHDVKDKQACFLDLLKEKHDQIDSLDGYPVLQQQYTNSVLREGERYMEFFDSLVIRFADIIDKEVNRFQ